MEPPKDHIRSQVSGQIVPAVSSAAISAASNPSRKRQPIHQLEVLALAREAPGAVLQNHHPEIAVEPRLLVRAKQNDGRGPSRRLALTGEVGSDAAMHAYPVFADMPTTVFETMSGLARRHNAINLGQGFPDSSGPEPLRRLAAEALMTGSNQYPPSRGLPELREAVVEHYGRLQGLALSIEGVLVTSGATEALAAAILAYVRPGDEVVIFEPAYDAYRPLIERAGGMARAVRLEPPLWRLTEAAIEAAIGPRTRALLFNTPHNPTARVFDAGELALLAAACVRHDLIAISDEVWEHIVFDGRAHRSLLAEPGMQDRTIKIGSAGKMFGMTGWKIGFVCGDPALVEPVAKAHQFLTFTTPPNLQSAVAVGLGGPIEAFDTQRQDLQRSRDRLAMGLSQAGYVLTPGEGTYFLNLDLAASGLALSDEVFCRRIVTEFGVAAIPVSAFVAGAPEGRIVRLCFAKADPVLDRAIQRLGEARIAMSRLPSGT